MSLTLDLFLMAACALAGGIVGYAFGEAEGMTTTTRINRGGINPPPKTRKPEFNPPGQSAHSHATPCHNCGGMGVTTHDILHGGTEHDTEELECDVCKGTGNAPSQPTPPTMPEIHVGDVVAIEDGDAFEVESEPCNGFIEDGMHVRHRLQAVAAIYRTPIWRRE